MCGEEEAFKNLFSPPVTAATAADLLFCAFSRKSAVVMAISWVKLILLQATVCSNYRVAILAKFVTPHWKSDKNGDKVSQGFIRFSLWYLSSGSGIFEQNWWMLTTYSPDSQFEILWNFLIRSHCWLLLWRIFAILLPVVVQTPLSPLAFRESVFIGTMAFICIPCKQNFMMARMFVWLVLRSSCHDVFDCNHHNSHSASHWFSPNSCRVLFSRLPPIPGQQCQRRRIVLIEWIEAFTSCLIIRIVHSWNAMNGKPFTRINVRCSFVRSFARRNSFVAWCAHQFSFLLSSLKLYNDNANEMEKLIFALVRPLLVLLLLLAVAVTVVAAADSRRYIIHSLGTFHICVRSSNFSIGKREWVY